jgi:hypothetical protein
MRKYFLIGASLIFALSSTGALMAQDAIVCEQEFDKAGHFISAEHDRWADAIKGGNLREDVRDALLVIVKYSRDNAINGAEGKKVQCLAKYAPAEEIMNTAVALFSNGLSSIAQGSSAYVDTSEIVTGYPLGGPSALVPKLREQTLKGDRGTVANFIRDPWKCLTFRLC